jgi:RecB family exonuclease
LQAHFSAPKPVSLSFLSFAEWQAVFPALKHPDVSVVLNIDTLPLNHPSSSIQTHSAVKALCCSKLGEEPKLAIVEHPWQSQWLKQSCLAYFKEQSCPALVFLMPKILTLGQWLDREKNTHQHSKPLIYKREAAIYLCDSLKQLNVESLTSDSARYALAVQMVALIQEIDTRATLPSHLLGVGQLAKSQLNDPSWLSREGQWLSICQSFLTQLEQDTHRVLQWRAHLTQLTQNLAHQPISTLTLLMPAVHPGLMMHVFLSQLDSLLDERMGDCLYIALPDLNNTPSIDVIRVEACAHFEDEAQHAANIARTWLKSNEKNVAIVAHDRVLGRRCAALLARHRIPVEDRVGWALSTTVAASCVRGVLSSWLSHDVPTLLAWLGLPMVQSALPYTCETLEHLRHRWHQEKILPEGQHFIFKVLHFSKHAVANNLTLEHPSAQAVIDCLGDWQKAKLAAHKLATVSNHAQHLMAYLQPIATVLQRDKAGEKVWRELQKLSAFDRLCADTPSSLISLSTFTAIVDEVFEAERFSISTHSYDLPDAARVIFIPFYEAAWCESEHILMLGCNDTHFPATPNNPTPLLSSVRRELNIPLPVSERSVWLHLLSRQKIALHALFTPNESGNPSRLSAWLNGAIIHNATTSITASNHSDGIDTVGFEAAFGKQSQAVVNTVALPTEISVSKLSHLMQCHYRFTLESVFKIKPLGVPAYWPSYNERGNLLHQALETMKINNQSLSATELLEYLRGALQILLSEKLPYSGRYAALLADCERTLATYTSAHQQRLSEGWKIESTETPVESYALISHVRVHGKIDRIDRIHRADTSSANQDGYAVLDYKTSAHARLKSKQIAPAVDAQLVLYAALLTLNQRDVTQAAYWRLHDGLYQSHQTSSALKDRYHTKNTLLVVNDLSEHVDKISTQLRQHWQVLKDTMTAQATPSETACEYCEYAGVCRTAYIHSIDTPTTQTIPTTKTA